VGFWFACTQAVYAYVGVEIIGIVAEETERPRQTLPHAVRRVSYRMAFYYVLGMLVLGLNVSVNDPRLANSVQSSSLSSPFALMMERAGLPLKHFVNAAALIASLSVANTRLYICVISVLSHSLMAESDLVCTGCRPPSTRDFQEKEPF
jgi:yeast amino acid transporter